MTFQNLRKHTRRLVSRFRGFPLKTPKHIGGRDRHDPKPGRRGYREASGIFLIGRDHEDKELWFGRNDIMCHMLVYGATGSGKTESLMAFGNNALMTGSGLVFLDPKGEVKLVHEIFLMARRVSREDDLLVLNFMQAGANTFNPFAEVPTDAILNLLLSLLPPPDNGANIMFQRRATLLVQAVVPVLCALREKKLPLTDGVPYWKKESMDFNLNTFRNYLGDPTLCASLVHPVEGNSRECEAVAEIVEKPLLDALKAALHELKFDVENTKSERFRDQFGYAKGYLGYPLTALAGVYGKIFNVESADIDMRDVLFDRRILVGVLPTLEKKPQECQNLGKITLSAIKNALTSGLEVRLRKKTNEVIGSIPSAPDFPGIVIVDEYPIVMTTGFEVTLTQSRSLGFAIIIGAQNHATMQAMNPKACEQIVVNTASKLFMKVVDKSSWEFIKSQFENCEPRDFMDQKEGEFHLVFRGKAYKGSTFYLTPAISPKVHFRVNRFLPIPSDPEWIRENVGKWLENPPA